MMEAETGAQSRRLATFLQPLGTKFVQRGNLDPSSTAPDGSKEMPQVPVDPQVASIWLFSIYILTLSDTERTVLRMLQVEGLGYQAAAKRLGILPADIARVAFLARRKLHERMGQTLSELD